MEDHRRERFGRYEILGELGRGAMGIVYKARDPKINRVVAVKTISLAGQEPKDEAEYRERFLREAEAAGRLSHPGIVTIFDVGEEPETRSPYIVMEFVDGPSLEKMLAADNRTLPLETALQLTLELAEALDCAHGQGVVHRDLKPANILITQDGHAKIADFGIAKLNLANLTLNGRTLGTPAYMSPEQLSGEEVDGRSDLFSLGVILYSVLTGYRPFQGNSALTVSFKVVNRDPIPVTVLDTELPQGLDYIISRAMTKDPAQRYQRGMEMVLDIQELRAGREPWSKTKQPSSVVADLGHPPNVMPGGLPAGQRGVAMKPRISGRPLPPALLTAEKVLQKMRETSFVAAAVLLGGLLVVGFGLSRTIWPRKTKTSTLAAAARPKTFSTEGAPSLVTTVNSPPPAETAPTQTAAVPVAKSTKPVLARAPARVLTAAPKPATAPKAAATTPVPQVSPATLDIEVTHKFAEAHLSIWADDHLVYTHVLEGTSKQRLIVLHRVQGHEFHAVQIPPGKHRLKVRVVSETDSYDHSDSVAGEFSSGKEAMLQINFDKRGEMQLSLQ